MNVIKDYLEWRGDITLNQSPFNEVDAAILARFSYEPFEGIVSENVRDSICIKEVCSKLLNTPELNDHIVNDMDIDFIRQISSTKRFGDMKVSGFVNDTDENRQIQFSACVFDIDDEENYYIAFRGTDNTIIGWKEDFNMGYAFPVPAQVRALEYFERVANTLHDGSFIIGGHSKGGNLSVYAATYCNERYNNAILDVYNFDGPGFTQKVQDINEFHEIESRIHTFVPEFSIVGMLLEHIVDYDVIPSNETGIMQHELLTWETTATGFVKKERVAKGSKFIDQTVRDWISNLDNEQCARFVDTVFDFMMQGDAHTLADFQNNSSEYLNSIIKTFSGMDEDAKKGFFEATKMLFESASNTLKKDFSKTKK